MRNKKATTRTSRLKQKQRKEIKKNAISILKTIIKDIGYLLIGLIYIVKETYTAFEKSFLKVWGKFPKWLIRVIVWTTIVNIMVLNDKAPEVIEKIKSVTEIKEVYAVKEIMVEPKKCEWGIYECAIYDTALEYGLNDNQAKISIAISKHETATYTSDIFKNKNNIGGLYNSGAECFYAYKSVEDGIDAFIKNLKNGYFDKDLNTIEDIQKKYAPLNVENDPTNLNSNWVSGVTYYYNQLV